MKYRIGMWGALKTIELILSTCSVRIYGLDQFLQTIGTGPALLAVWHNRLALAPYALSPYLYQVEKAVALISKNSDGNWIQAIVNRYPNAQSIRIDTKRKIHAFQDILLALKRKNLVLITPDGSRGPACVAKMGVLVAAKETGHPIIPFTWEGPCWKLNSWDQFRIPKPFSEINIYYKPPLYLKSHTSLKEDKKKLEDLLTIS